MRFGQRHAVQQRVFAHRLAGFAVQLDVEGGDRQVLPAQVFGQDRPTSP
jgi:hypothetical protein